MYERLQKLNLVTSHRTATTLIHLIGKDHDELVKKWRDRLTEGLNHKVFPIMKWAYREAVDPPPPPPPPPPPQVFLDLSTANNTNKTNIFMYITESPAKITLQGSSVFHSDVTPFGIQNWETDSDDSDEDYTEESSGSDSDGDLDYTSDEEVLSSSDGEDADCDSDFEFPMIQEAHESTAGDSTPSSTQVVPSAIYTFKLCGDNLDTTVKVRYMRSDKGNRSLHYFHSYAVLD